MQQYSKNKYGNDNYQPFVGYITESKLSENDGKIFLKEKTFAKKLEITYKFRNLIEIQLPLELSSLIECVKKLEKILDLEDNWNGINSESYSLETWVASVSFLLNYGKEVYSEFRSIIDIPKIYPSTNGSIDIDWETDNYGFLINIAKGGEKATYYADDKALQMTEGVFNPNQFNINLLPKAINERTY